MSNLISEYYKGVLEKEHKPAHWGQTAKNMIGPITHYANDNNIILDYGAGHGGLRKALEKQYPGKYTVIDYEPGRKDASEPPKPCDYVVCIDVLEHVEPEFIDNVLDDLKRVTRKTGYFTISCRPAAKILNDGQNAHLIVEPQDWWKEKLIQRFKINAEVYDHSDKNYQVYVELLDE